MSLLKFTVETDSDSNDRTLVQTVIVLQVPCKPVDRQGESGPCTPNTTNLFRLVPLFDWVHYPCRESRFNDH